MISALALLAVSNIALHVEEVREVSTTSTSKLLYSLASAIELRTGREVVLDSSDRVSCQGKTRAGCVAKIRGTNRGGDVVMLVLVGGITKLRVIGQRFVAGDVSEEHMMDLPRRSEEWEPVLRKFVEGIYPEARMVGSRDVYQPARGETSNHLPSWIALGTAAVSTAVAIGFEVKSGRAEDDLSMGVHSAEEAQDLIDEHRTAQRISSGFLIAAGVSLGAAMIFELLDL